MPATPSTPSLWRRFRTWFRVLRIVGWLLLLALVCAGLYVNQIGLPGFIKRPLLEQLHQRGLELEFTRLRLMWYTGIVAENVRFSPARLEAGPELTARRVEVALNGRELLGGRFQVDALGLHAGRLTWPVAESNGPPHTLVVEDLEARLRLLPGDEWSLEDFRARFAGANFFLSGNITNASALRNWNALGATGERVTPASQTRPAPGTVQRRLRILAEAVARMTFATPPELRIFLSGDARDPQTFAVRLAFAAPEAETPWGHFSRALLNARLFAASVDLPSRAELTLEAGDACTPWADVQQLALDLKLGVVPGQASLVDGDATLHTAGVQTRWATATNAGFTARWIHSLTNPIPLSGHGELHLDTAWTKWANGRNARLAVALAPATNPPAGNPGWAWWTNLLPYQLSWAASLGGAQSGSLRAENLACAGTWLAPVLVVTNLHGETPRGGLDARARLDVSTRAAGFEVEADLDVHELDPLLTEKTQRWLNKYSWVEPPQVRARGAVTLPAWTNRQPDWLGEVRPTLCLAGEFTATNGGAYLGVSMDWARSHFTYSNLNWHLPDLEARRPDGQLRAEHRANELTREYYWSVHSTLDPRIVRPLLTTNQQRGFDLFTFSAPPTIDAEVWGRFHAYDQFGGRGRIALTNATFRGSPEATLVAGFAYTNQVLEAFDVRVWAGTQHIDAARVVADFNAQRVHFTEVNGTADPLLVTRAIGPRTTQAIEPYHFAQPPTAHLEGTVPMRGTSGADLRVTVLNGGPFQWWKFNVPHVTGTVLWQERVVTITNVATAFYSGEAQGWGVFDTAVTPGTDFSFALTTKNTDLRALMADLTTPTNRLEGSLDGTLHITHANSSDWQTWNGNGEARLRDGWIWSIPIFGVLSDPLDNILPGLGNSRISSGEARCIITNGVIFSDSLEMRALTTRLKYVGTVDLCGQVEARVRAEPLRDTWVVGRVVSLALWPVTKIFEYKISGPIHKPKAEPLRIPKLLLVPLHPFQALKGLFPEDSAGTNAAPAAASP